MQIQCSIRNTRTHVQVAHTHEGVVKYIVNLAAHARRGLTRGLFRPFTYHSLHSTIVVVVFEIVGWPIFSPTLLQKEREVQAFHLATIHCILLLQLQCLRLLVGPSFLPHYYKKNEKFRPFTYHSLHSTFVVVVFEIVGWPIFSPILLQKEREVQAFHLATIHCILLLQLQCSRLLVGPYFLPHYCKKNEKFRPFTYHSTAFYCCSCCV